MNKAQFLLARLGNREERALWQEAFNSLPLSHRDLHFGPAYAEIFQRTFAQDIVAIIFRASDRTIIQPLVLKRVSREHNNSPLEPESYRDAESLYGMGGAISNGALDDAIIQEYVSAREEIYKQHSIVTEFCSFHPLFVQSQEAITARLLSNVSERKQCAVIDLRQPYHRLWANIEDRQRKAIISARKRGIKVLKRPSNTESLDNFHNDYLLTMERVEASSQWHFPPEFFINTLESLGKDCVSIFNAYVDDQRVASYLLIHYGEVCYYHFSAADPNYRSYNASHLLMFDTMLWAKSQGFNYYFLGGGASADGRDSLFKFKQSFANKTFPLKQLRSIVNEAGFTHIMKSKDPQFQGIPASIDEFSYFPPYRA